MPGLVSTRSSLQAGNHHHELPDATVGSVHTDQAPWLSRQQHHTDPTAYPTTDCSCGTLGQLHAHPTLPAPPSLDPPALGEPDPQRIATTGLTPSPPPPSDLFSEVYVISLASRQDRRQYICAVLQRLGIPALIWPALSSDSEQVKTIRRGLAQERKRQAQRLAAQHSTAQHSSHKPAASVAGTTPEDDPAGTLPLRQLLMASSTRDTYAALLSTTAGAVRSKTRGLFTVPQRWLCGSFIGAPLPTPLQQNVNCSPCRALGHEADDHAPGMATSLV